MSEHVQWPTARARYRQALARNRQRRAVELIRALDQHRILARCGRSTNTDAEHIKAAFDGYRRASGY